MNDAYDVRTCDDHSDDHQRDGEDGSDRGDTTIRGENYSSHDGHDVYANGGFISRRIGIIIFFIW